MHLQRSSEFLELFKSAGKRFNQPGHVSHSEGIRRDLSVWFSGHVARSEGVPKGSLGVGFGTRGMLRRSSEGVSRCGLRDTWHAPKELRRGLSVWSLGTRGTLGMHPERFSLGARLPGHVAIS